MSWWDAIIIWYAGFHSIHNTEYTYSTFNWCAIDEQNIYPLKKHCNPPFRMYDFRARVFFSLVVMKTNYNVFGGRIKHGSVAIRCQIAMESWCGAWFNDCSVQSVKWITFFNDRKRKPLNWNTQCKSTWAGAFKMGFWTFLCFHFDWFRLHRNFSVIEPLLLFPMRSDDKHFIFEYHFWYLLHM